MTKAHRMRGTPVNRPHAKLIQKRNTRHHDFHLYISSSTSQGNEAKNYYWDPTTEISHHY
uniref:Uncharacterized protein n=1 Tax=Arion vulgaris TaxID=1028688 RepID=A0A0B6Z9L3_9EUPU